MPKVDYLNQTDENLLYQFCLSNSIALRGVNAISDTNKENIIAWHRFFEQNFNSALWASFSELTLELISRKKYREKVLLDLSVDQREELFHNLLIFKSSRVEVPYFDDIRSVYFFLTQMIFMRKHCEYGELFYEELWYMFNGLVKPIESIDSFVRSFTHFEKPAFNVKYCENLTYNEHDFGFKLIQGIKLNEITFEGISISKKEAKRLRKILASNFVTIFDDNKVKSALLLSKLCNDESFDVRFMETFKNSTQYLWHNLEQLNVDLEFWKAYFNFLFKEKATMFSANRLNNLFDYMRSIENKEEYSFRRKTLNTILRESNVWHDRIALEAQKVKVKNDVNWAPKYLPKPYTFKAPNENMQIRELNSKRKLNAESAEMHHCISTYWKQAREGYSTILSLRDISGEKTKTILTIEMVNGKIAEAKGKHNSQPKYKHLMLVDKFLAEYDELMIKERS